MQEFRTKLKKTVEKMVRIAQGRTGASKVYADMLLSMLPNSTHKVCLDRWCYKADMDDFETILNFMILLKKGDRIMWEYEKYIFPYKEELREIAKENHV